MNDVNTTVSVPCVPRWIHGLQVQLRNCVLLIESGPDVGQRFGPLAEQTTIGRELWCDIGLTDPGVSKQHCELAWTPEGLRLRDIGSTNGVLCGGMRVYDVMLGADDRFRIGSTTIRVAIVEGTHTRTSATLDPSLTMVGASHLMRRLFGMMHRVGLTDLPVLLLGETGTGKTALAEAMHKISTRKDKQLVSINCAALPTELMESVLFGHVRGAFTGAHRDAPGIFVQADGGSVLLDEIGEIPMALQAKLLRVLEARRVRPVGGDREIAVDFRLFCATNRTLMADVSDLRFRQDLYYRIAGVALTAPPLRDRIDDLAMLAEWLTMRAANKLRAAGAACPVTEISPGAIRLLEQHTWPGNVRELESVIARAVALAEASRIERDDILLSPWTGDEDMLLPPAEARTSGGVLSFREFKASLLDRYQKPYFQQLLAHTGGNVSKAALVSGLSRTYLRAMMRRYEMRG